MVLVVFVFTELLVEPVLFVEFVVFAEVIFPISDEVVLVLFVLVVLDIAVLL